MLENDSAAPYLTGMNRFAHLSLGLAIFGAVTLVVLFTPLGKRPLQALFPVGEIAPTDFATLVLAETPNQYLVCPPGVCRATAQAHSPVFEVPVERLREAWETLVAAEPRLSRIGARDDRQFDYVQRTLRFRFPDIVTVRFVALSPSRSTLALYSRSIYGQSDFGANRARVETWLGKLRAAVP